MAVSLNTHWCGETFTVFSRTDTAHSLVIEVAYETYVSRAYVRKVTERM
jgi:transposase-like protein